MARRSSYPSARRHRPPCRTRSPYHRRGRAGFAFWLLIAITGGFGGTLAALQIVGSHDARASGLAILKGAIPVEPPDLLSARFGVCHSGGGHNCVVDGDTFWFEGEKYRIADIDTPETHPARCAEEAALGAAATERLHGLLNAGDFSLDAADRDVDIHGRKLRIVTRGGESIGERLVAEGLARPWEGGRRPWC